CDVVPTVAPTWPGRLRVSGYARPRNHRGGRRSGEFKELPIRDLHVKDRSGSLKTVFVREINFATRLGQGRIERTIERDCSIKSLRDFARGFIGNFKLHRDDRRDA